MEEVRRDERILEKSIEKDEEMLEEGRKRRGGDKKKKRSSSKKKKYEEMLRNGIEYKDVRMYGWMSDGTLNKLHAAAVRDEHKRENKRLIAYFKGKYPPKDNGSPFLAARSSYHQAQALKRGAGEKDVVGIDYVNRIVVDCFKNRNSDINRILRQSKSMFNLSEENEKYVDKFIKNYFVYR